MAGKNTLREKSKALWLKGMKLIGNTAANIANNTKYKVDEVTLQNRRRELLGDIAGTAYALWMKGEEFPDQISAMLDELQQLDNQLIDLKTEKYAYANRNKDNQADPAGTEGNESQPEPGDGGEQADGPEPGAEETETTAVPSAPPVPEKIPDTVSPVQNGINGYFDDVPSVGKMAEKVNSSLDQLSERIRAFPAEDGKPGEDSAE